MSTRIPPSLKWLIDKRARLEAEILKSRASIDAAKGLLNELAELEVSLIHKRQYQAYRIQLPSAKHLLKRRIKTGK